MQKRALPRTQRPNSSKKQNEEAAKLHALRDLRAKVPVDHDANLRAERIGFFH
jgi:hypothetical protein